MSDDWSLKQERLLVDGFYSYLEDDIETLRQKLIEDFEDLFDWCNKSVPRLAIMIINKRFGVEK